MSRFWRQVRRIPRWGWYCGFGYTAIIAAMFKLGHILSHALGTYDRALVWKIAAIDDRFQVVPVFVLFYVYTYAFWVMGPIAVSLTKKRNFVNYTVGLFVSCFIGFLFLALMPTLMDRAGEGLMQIGERPGFCNWLLGLLYKIDGGEEAFNLFPSFHCLVSLYCWLGVRGQPEISRGFRAYSLVMAILICLSTLYTKQHYIPDVFGGVAIPLIVYWIVEKVNPGKRWEQGGAEP